MLIHLLLLRFSSLLFVLFRLLAFGPPCRLIGTRAVSWDTYALVNPVSFPGALINFGSMLLDGSLHPHWGHRLQV